MPPHKSKSLQHIEQAMEQLDENSFRYKILENVKTFKTAWIDLGRMLYSAYKDKMYKAWGYSTFDIYVQKELGIRPQTAGKLLHSYYFLEKEAPAYLSEEHTNQAEASALPSYESINQLRLAKAKKGLSENDYTSLKKDVFEKGKDSNYVKQAVTSFMREREDISPEEAREKRRIATIRRYIATLKSLQQDVETAKLLPVALIKQASELIHKLESEID